MEPIHSRPTTPPIDAAFDPEQFRKLGHQVIDLLADTLAGSRSPDSPLRSAQSPDDAVTVWRDRLRDPSTGDLLTLIQQSIAPAFRTHHPHNLGHQVGPVLPAAALVDLVGSLLDTGNGIFEVGNPATPMERAAVLDLAGRLGLPPGADGILTSGGSIGNLTAMLAMRQRATGSWDTGSRGERYAVLVSSDAHYCVTRAAKIMGWGEAGIIKVPVDQNHRLDVHALDTSLRSAISGGTKILGVVANAGSTATGIIDPLNAIADFCGRNDLWLHVDAAHAGAFIFSQKASPMLDGIARADSVVIDFHKMLLGPSLLTAVLFRNAADSFQTFAQNAGYLWRQDDTTEWWDAAKRTIECTRPMLGLRAFALLQLGAAGLFESYIDHTLELTHKFAAMLRDADDFELLTTPQSNIICYRYAPHGHTPEKLDTLNRSIRAALLESDEFYIVEVEKCGRHYLRSAIMTPFAHESVFTALIDRIRKHGSDLLRTG